MVGDGFGCVGRCPHANAVVPKGGQTGSAGAEKVVDGPGYEQATAGRYTQFDQSHLVRSWVGLVETGPLGCDDDIEFDPGTSDRFGCEFLGAVRDDTYRHPFAAQRAEYFANLRPGLELAVASGEQRRQGRRQPYLGRGIGDERLIGTVGAGRVGAAQIGCAPLSAIFRVTGDNVPQGPGVEERRQQIEQDRVEPLLRADRHRPNIAFRVRDCRIAGGKGDPMSKAFVKESDDEAGLPDEPPAVPLGVKNYMTPRGHRHMQDELRQLLRVERPKVVETVAWAAGNGDRSENGDYIYGKRRLREIDRRIRFLAKRLESAEVVDPRQQKRRDQVFFGATVTFATEDGTEKTITIVGIDEADFARGQVSWVSPIARALLKAHEGDTVELRAPAGVEQIEVLEIRYAGADDETG